MPGLCSVFAALVPPAFDTLDVVVTIVLLKVVVLNLPSLTLIFFGAQTCVVLSETLVFKLFVALVLTGFEEFVCTVVFETLIASVTVALCGLIATGGLF